LPHLNGGCFIEANNFPVDFALIRASDVPRFVNDENATTSVGITGSDIIWEAGLGKDYGKEIPIYQFNQSAKQSRLYVGFTERFRELLGRTVNYQDLNQTTIATKFPKISQDYLGEKGIMPELIVVPGADEAMQYIFPNCNAVLGVVSSGATLQENRIDILETFYDVSLRFVEQQEKMTNNDLLIFNELQERIAVALERRRML